MGRGGGGGPWPQGRVPEALRPHPEGPGPALRDHSLLSGPRCRSEGKGREGSFRNFPPFLSLSETGPRCRSEGKEARVMRASHQGHANSVLTHSVHKGSQASALSQKQIAPLYTRQHLLGTEVGAITPQKGGKSLLSNVQTFKLSKLSN